MADPRVTASRAVLIEVMTLLAAEVDKLVVVGGWVPELLYPGRGHIGSLDVDLALDHAVVLTATGRPPAQLTNRSWRHCPSGRDKRKWLLHNATEVEPTSRHWSRATTHGRT